MNRTRTPLALIAALGLALAGQVVVPTGAQAATLKSMAGLTTINSPGLYDLSTATTAAVTVAVDDVAVTGTAGALTLRVSNNRTLTLVNATITGGTSLENAVRADLCATGCGLRLLGTNTMRAAVGTVGAGVWVPPNTSLTITGPGTLNATGQLGGAGIGGRNEANSGSITIRHATVVAQGGWGDGGGGGAGIGGGSWNDNGPIEIVNSSVTATGGSGTATPRAGGGAGIGGGAAYGAGGSPGTVNITASVVVATGGNGTSGTTGSGGGGAGIGGGGQTQSARTGPPVVIDAVSVVQAVGGAGAGSSTHGGGGGGAAIGGGGGISAVGGSNTGAIGIASATLAAGSAGGPGGTGTPNNGGAGALCGTGGSGATATGSGADGVEATLTSGDTCALSSQVVDLSSRPDPDYPGYDPGPTHTDPVDQTIPFGETASFTVAPHNEVDTFQWQESKDGGTTWGDVTDGGAYAGAKTDTLTLSDVPQTMDGYLYRCVIDYWALPGTTTSNEALLTVTLIPRTFTASPWDGVSGTLDTTKLQLEFNGAVTGLTASDITLTDDTGSAVKGSLASNSGGATDTVWYLELTTVNTEGDIKVAIADFGDYWVTNSPQTSAVYKARALTPVTFTPVQVGGVSTKVDSTGIELTFSEPVTGLDAGDITVTDDTGEVIVGALSEASGTGTNTVWLLDLDSIEAEGEVIVAIANFGDYRVTTIPQRVWVYRATRYLVTINQMVGGSVLATPLRAFEGQTVTIQAAAVLPFRFAGWKVDPAVTWVGGDASTLTARFTMPDGDVEVTPMFVLAFVNPPPGPNEPVFNPDVVNGPEVVPDPGANKPPGGNTGASGFLAYTGDNQSSAAAGLALLASLMGILALALRRKHQPSSYCARHRGVAVSR